MRIALYVLAITGANVLTAQFGSFALIGLPITWGSFAVGLAFVVRDLIQMKYGRKNTYIIIAVAMALSAVMTQGMGNGIAVTIASMFAFAASESVDTEIFTRYRGSLVKKVVLSGMVGSIVDSIAFNLCSPPNIMTGIDIRAVLGQSISKILMQVIGYAIVFNVLYRNHVKHYTRVGGK